MPDKWTAVQHERLFFVMIEQNKPHPQDLVDGWKKKYPNEAPPTAGAIKNHINDLIRKAGGGRVAKGNTGTTPRRVAAIPRKATAAPRKSTTPKTPSSGNRRKRSNEASETEMSDADESEPETSKKEVLAKVGRRSSIPRSRKDIAKTYKEDSTDDEDDEDGSAVEAGLGGQEVKTAGADGLGDAFEEFVNFDGAAEKETSHLTGATPKKRRIRDDDSGDDSDGSTFSANFT